MKTSWNRVVSHEYISFRDFHFVENFREGIYEWAFGLLSPLWWLIHWGQWRVFDVGVSDYPLPLPLTSDNYWLSEIGLPMGFVGILPPILPPWVSVLLSHICILWLFVPHYRREKLSHIYMKSLVVTQSRKRVHAGIPVLFPFLETLTGKGDTQDKSEC